MRLSAIAEVSSFLVQLDGDFSTLGFLSMPRPGMLTFVESRRAFARLDAAPRPVAVVTTPLLAGDLRNVQAVALADNPRRSFFDAHNYLASATDFYGVQRPSSIDRTAVIDPSAVIPREGVRIGPRTIVGPRVVIQGRCRIGADVVLHPGVVLGGEGFQSSRFPDGMRDMAHAGSVEVADRVVVHANAVIARAVFDEATVLGEWTRVGNLAFVSHNVRVGRRCFIGHGAVVNGNVVIGDDAWVGPGCTVADCLRIGARAHVSLGSAVIGDLADGVHVTGNVAIEHRRYLRHLARATGRPPKGEEEE